PLLQQTVLGAGLIATEQHRIERPLPQPLARVVAAAAVLQLQVVAPAQQLLQAVQLVEPVGDQEQVSRCAHSGNSRRVARAPTIALRARERTDAPVAPPVGGEGRAGSGPPMGPAWRG